MSLLSEVVSIAEERQYRVETGVFSEPPPDTYIVLTPIADGFDLSADNIPLYETQEVRVSIFSKENYNKIKDNLTMAFIDADMTITDRRYITYESETGYHHYAIDVAKTYDWRND